MINYLVGGFEHGFYDFQFIGNTMECHHPNWLIFFRGVGQPPTRDVLQCILDAKSVSKMRGVFTTNRTSDHQEAVSGVFRSSETGKEWGKKIPYKVVPHS